MPVFSIGAKPGKGKFLDACGHTVELNDDEALPPCPQCEHSAEVRWWRLI
ncbi:hypothetical protein GCM10009774_02870 [Cellulomonas gelida]|uniref:Uncharacterized protein n=1 Tax=Cellulomonas gelida TaxID=1712 RepID=A0A4Y3KLP0_9CELL|nr:hypothetical protein CGE01nite_20440 [Cellulomonas gelida]GGL15885.1 hypothetical protein GCM10009774_02870 [Cellulomonas gelida]